MKKKKTERYPDYELVKNPDGSELSHLLDSIWVKKDHSELKIVFATGEILNFGPVEE